MYEYAHTHKTKKQKHMNQEDLIYHPHINDWDFSHTLPMGQSQSKLQ